MQLDRLPIWLVKDRWQRDIVLYEDTWVDHILPGTRIFGGTKP